MRIDNNHRNNQYYRDTKLLATLYGQLQYYYEYYCT